VANSPRQIGYPPQRSTKCLKHSFTDTIEVQLGDLFILMTDGVLDNLLEDEILRITN